MRHLGIILAFLLTAGMAGPAMADDGTRIADVLGKHYYAAGAENLEEYLASLALEPGEETKAAELAQGMWAKIETRNIQIGQVEIALSPEGDMALARYSVSGTIRDKASGDSFPKQTTYIALLVKQGAWKIKKSMPEVVFRQQFKEESLQRQSARMLALADGKALPAADDTRAGEDLKPRSIRKPTARTKPSTSYRKARPKNPAPSRPQAQVNSTNSGTSQAKAQAQSASKPGKPGNPPSDIQRKQAARSFSQGTDAYNQQRYQEAADHYRAYLSVHPGDRMATERLALAQQMIQNQKFGSLQVLCQPQAQVFVDGKLVGKTPLNLNQVRIGSRLVEVRTAHGKQSRTLMIKSLTKTSIEFDLRNAQKAEMEEPAKQQAAAAVQTKPAPQAGRARPARSTAASAPAAPTKTPAATEGAPPPGVNQKRGFILEVSGNEVTIDLGSNQKVKPGDQFVVLRMKQLVHPVSRKKYFWKKRAGIIQVTQVQDELALAEVVEGKVEVGLPIVPPEKDEGPAGFGEVGE